MAMVPGVATADPGHLSTSDGPVRFVDALRRGLALYVDVMGGVDWFDHADTPSTTSAATSGCCRRGADAVAAGSLSALDPRAVFVTHDPT
jgi:hypothetical protein